jgi:ketosteroid isomerase-like protein
MRADNRPCCETSTSPICKLLGWPQTFVGVDGWSGHGSLSNVATVDSVRTLLATFDAYADRDFDRLADLYAENVTWGGPEPGPWDCMNREDVFGMFRVRIRRNREVVFDRIFGTGSKVLLSGHSADSREDWFVTVFTVEEGRIVRAQDYPSTDAALDALKHSGT